MRQVSGKLSNVPTVQLDLTVLNQEGHILLDYAELAFTVLQDPGWILLCHVLLVSTVRQEVILQKIAQLKHSPMPQSNQAVKTVLLGITVFQKM